MSCKTVESGAHDETEEDEPKSPTFILKMLNLCKEFALMAFIFLAYAALTNQSPPKMSKGPAAYPFFSKGSHVTDWFKGQITAAIEEARSSDIAFVMFYAPWDAESQSARKQFEIAAQLMHEQVTFSAINCWQPESECKRQYSKVYKWPVLIAYPTHGRGIQYNGPLEAFHMVKFLQNMCKPVVRPQKIEDLYGQYDTIISAQINVLPGSYEYIVFYSTALRFLERDPFRDIAFAVIPQSKEVSPNIKLHLWNETINFEEEWNPETLSSWILKNLNQISGWIAPSGVKSLNLAGFIQPGPTLILFTPKNPLVPVTDYFNLIRQVAYEYYNCANDPILLKKLKLVSLERQRSKDSYQRLKRKCSQEKNRPQVVITTNNWSNNSLKDFCSCANCESDTQISRECRDFFMAQEYQPSLFEKNQTSGVNVTGLGCGRNFTLEFIALDSLRFYHFAEKLGVDLNSPAKSGVAIINEKMETHHVMEAPLTSTNVRSFVRNFTEKTLARSLSSRVRLKTKNSHMYPHLQHCQRNQFCVVELTSEDFLGTIMQTNRVVIIFYYSKQCSFCNGQSFVFLTVAKLLSNVTDVLFARIDGDVNLLPWEYTMESYPTILFIPKNRKSESRVFPKNLSLTVPNLVGFILANVQPAHKLKTMWTICCQRKIIGCIAAVRMETLNVINQTLREWRNSTRKQPVLHKLQLLRHLHLLLAHSPDETENIQTFFNKLRD